MVNLGEILASAEKISNPKECFEYLDSQKLSTEELRTIVRARCRTIEFSAEAYKRYAPNTLYDEAERHNLLVAAQSPQGCRT